MVFRFLAILVILFVPFIGKAQIIETTSWSYDVSTKDVAVGDEIDLIFKAEIDPEWYMYSSDFECEVGPIVTTFEFVPHESYELVGGIRPIGAKKKYSDIFECEYTYFLDHAEYRQTIKVLTRNLIVSGAYDFQTCTDVDGKCISYDDEFTFNNIEVAGGPSPNEGNSVKPGANDKDQVKTENGPDEVDNPQIPESQKEDKNDSEKDIAPKEKSADSIMEPSGGLTFTEINDQPITAGLENNPTVQITKNEAGMSVIKMDPFFGDDYEKPKESYWLFMLGAFLAGLAALFTPCVFPMIPMTVSFFTGGSENKTSGKFKAFFYGLSIVAIYTLIGSLVAPLMGPETANDLATEWFPNIVFFSVFLLFALSFFGMFDIVLPSSFVNNMDRQADKGGWIGTFFMAFTLVLVSFSCTGPIVGTILVESAGGEVLKPILGMLSFSLAFAIPFTLFAIFPSWLNSLPKSGGWLNSVKVVLGFIELALAFKFLSIADQAFHWGILDREVNLAIWIVIFSLMGFYLLGKIKLPHDSDLKNISVLRLMFSVITFSFVVYLIPGMFGAPLKALAGYLPPMYTHDFDVAGLIRESDSNYLDNYLDTCDEPLYADFLHLPHGIQGYFDYEQALACAGEQNKPIFIDFTGHGCTNCREMEAVVWSDPKVLKLLKEEFVVVALYVDDKTELPEDQWYVSAYDQKVKKTIGKQNADLQIQRANNNAQPNYFLINQNQKALTEPIAYTSVDEFLEFLNTGIANFRQSKTLANQ